MLITASKNSLISTYSFKFSKSEIMTENQILGNQTIRGKRVLLITTSENHLLSKSLYNFSKSEIMTAGQNNVNQEMTGRSPHHAHK